MCRVRRYVLAVSACLLLDTIEAQELKPLVETEEAVYTHRPSENGSFPLWTYGSTILVRRGERLFFSATETLADAAPLNCVRWVLMERTEAGWDAIQRDEKERTREPSPIALCGDALIMSVNPTRVPDRRAGPAEPQLLSFSLDHLSRPPQVIEPPWSTEPRFTEHSYRGLGCDPSTGALLLMNVEAYRGQHWVYRDGAGGWANSGLVEFPAIDSYKGAIPIRFLYPGIALRDGAAHVITKGGVEDFIEERVDYRKSKGSKVWGRYHIGYCWSPDIATRPLSPWIYAVDVSRNAGEVWNCDLWVAPNGDCHILWWEKSFDTRLRPKYFADEKLVQALKHGILRSGELVFSQTLLQNVEGEETNRPQWGRFHETASGRLFVVTTEATPAHRTVNRLIEIRPDRSAGKPVTVPLLNAFTMLSMTSAAYGGTQPSDTLELVGRAAGLPPNEIRYACIRLVPAETPELTVVGSKRLMPGQGRTFHLTAKPSAPFADPVDFHWEISGTKRTGALLEYTLPPGLCAAAATVRATRGERTLAVARVRLSAAPEVLAHSGEVFAVEAEDFVGQGEGSVKIYAPEGVSGQAITYWHKDIGHWLEWAVTVPEEGRYLVFAHYATGSTNTRRELRMDGDIPKPEFSDIVFPFTGGWSGSADVWRFLQLGPPVHLTAGEHRFRMTNLGDGLGVDRFIFKRVQ